MTVPGGPDDGPHHHGPLYHGPLYHLALADEWAAALLAGVYERSTIGQSRFDVGFIHLSFADQVQGTADRFYGEAGDVVLLTISPALLDPAVAPIRVDPVGDTHFPHLYGPLPVDAVIEARPLARGADGRWRTGP
jgi:glutathione S-transferase